MPISHFSLIGCDRNPHCLLGECDNVCVCCVQTYDADQSVFEDHANKQGHYLLICVQCTIGHWGHD